uniref:Uncharacterized protein n=1 Tax=Ixodes ricinus TaxID=34613 RepID=A0A0K8RI21_IXORI
MCVHHVAVPFKASSILTRLKFRATSCLWQLSKHKAAPLCTVLCLLVRIIFVPSMQRMKHSFIIFLLVVERMSWAMHMARPKHLQASSHAPKRTSFFRILLYSLPARHAFARLAQCCSLNVNYFFVSLLFL